jgi:hypothetical protein
MLVTLGRVPLSSVTSLMNSCCKILALPVGLSKTGITSAITLNTTAAGVLPEFCHLPAATSNLTRTLKGVQRLYQIQKYTDNTLLKL